MRLPDPDRGAPADTPSCSVVGRRVIASLPLGGEVVSPRDAEQVAL